MCACVLTPLCLLKEWRVSLDSKMMADVIINAHTFNDSWLLFLDSRQWWRPWTASSSSQAATTGWWARWQAIYSASAEWWLEIRQTEHWTNVDRRQCYCQRCHCLSLPFIFVGGCVVCWRCLCLRWHWEDHLCYLWKDMEISNLEEGRALNSWLIRLCFWCCWSNSVFISLILLQKNVFTLDEKHDLHFLIAWWNWTDHSMKLSGSWLIMIDLDMYLKIRTKVLST